MSVTARRPPWAPLAIGVALGVVVLAYFRGEIAATLAQGVRFHGPDLALLARQSFAIKLHMAGALLATAVSVYLLAAPKGTRIHRILGWAWTLAMAAAVLASFFVTQVNHGRLSWLHILSGWTALALPVAVWAARTHRIELHRQNMLGMTIGGLFIAGALTFAPGRLMWALFFG